ncbi:hypothetical protein CDD82_3889 [Ophiocordyceps australis]|uniref:Zn(2)-C6 fungal-type domain-containing protein n=1 Tax=Ophiocordyceps australis TaxID=1399860 RepID=A0A2C5ZAD7_9HYPO|nr:hypothetical protein CDD82_3889 [Ophiocordyceps australis]
MDPAPPDAKRPRLGLSARSLPPPHSAHQRPHPPPPPHHPPPSARTGQLHPASDPSSCSSSSSSSSSYQQPYPPRPADHGPASASPHVHAHQHQQHQRRRPDHSDLDHRHQDQETLAPMQDQFRQLPHQLQHQHHPPSASTTQPLPYHQFQSRDSGIKRESGDDSQRPSSTGHAPDLSSSHSTALSSQSAAPLQSTTAYAPETQARHMSYDASITVPQQATIFRPTAYSSASSHQHSYEHQPCYQPATEPAYSVYPSVGSNKKKNTRASQACDQCRQLKAKCDELKPCKTCRDKGTECRYRDPVPKATDKAQADILDGINKMRQSLSSLASHVFRMSGRIVTLETSFSKFSGCSPTKPGSLPDEEMKNARNHSVAVSNASDDHFLDDDDAPQDVSHLGRLPLHLMADDEMEAEPGPPVPPGEHAIPINHTTLAGLLLEWPPIKELTKHHVESAGIRHVGEFPIGPEQNRGSLIVYGRGEDCHPSRHIGQTPDHGMLELADDASEIASPSPAADWGHLGGLSPGDSVDYRGGVLGFDGNPDFTESKVWRYVESFKDNILNMHPIVQPKVLHEWVRHFLDTLPKAPSRPHNKAHTSKSAFAVGSVSGVHTPVEATGSKRKRSPGPEAGEGSSTPGAVRMGRPERSIHNALVLIILALGKVCLSRECVPDALHHADALPQGSPLSRNGVPLSPTQGSPPSHSSHCPSSSLPSPRGTDRGPQSRRSSIHGPGAPRLGYGLKKNYEVIPGLEYFAFGTDILGNHIGAYKNMKNVYANIFAGLYQGQLGRPLESFAFIHQAGHKLQVIMRPSLDKLRRMRRSNELIQDPKYNQLALAFWTCLQLESDLIAEMPLPPSGLLSYEDDMPHPNLSLLKDYDERILDSYPAQLYLRTHLNSIHRLFYSPDDPLNPEKKAENKFNNVEVVANAVAGMGWAPPRFHFQEDEPPADEILAARLRGKYWGAQVITYRPFVRMILEFNHSQKHSTSAHPASLEIRQGNIYSVPVPSAPEMCNIDHKIRSLAQRGIKALIESTRSFHGLGEKRPIITNVFGTAHAQWGNLLVLAAAYRDPVLHSCIEEKLLQSLFKRTMQFLRQSATVTGSLGVDLHILEGLYRDLFHSNETRSNPAFGNGTGQHTPKIMTAPPPVAFTNGGANYAPNISPNLHMAIPHGR